MIFGKYVMASFSKIEPTLVPQPSPYSSAVSCFGSLVSNHSANTRSYLEWALINSYHIVLGHPQVRAQLAD